MLAGVLALQGDYQTHADALESIGVEAVEIRTPEDAGFANPKAPREARKRSAEDVRVAERPVPELLVLPGGESSTFDLLGRRYGLDFLVSAFAASGRTLFGTCAGAIWLGKGTHHRVTPLNLIDVTLERNAYGRQIDSFIAPISIRGMEGPFEAVFIRAPQIVDVGKNVEVLAEHEGYPVFVREKNIWLTTFHPERTNDLRIHRMIVESISGFTLQS